MASDLNPKAQPQPKDDEEYIAHQFSINAHWDAQKSTITVTVNDAVTKKQWEKVLTKNDYPNIKPVYDQMKVAIDSNKVATAFPDNNQPLDLVIMSQPNYINVSLPEKF